MVRSMGLIFLFTFVAACGGGSGSGSSAEPTPPVADTGGDNDDATTTPAPDDNNDDVGNQPDTGADDDAAAPPVVDNPGDALDQELAPLLANANITGDAAANRTLPQISDPLAQLGMKLFFSKSLGGDFDSACVTCHHPSLGGGDGLSLPVGVGANNPDLLGPGRFHAATALPNVPRNSPTVFNLGLWDTGLFWDSRVESFGKEEGANGAVSSIRTPDVAFGDVDLNAGANLPEAQARFPVTSNDEMRGFTFEAGNDNASVRNHLAARIGGYGVGAGEINASAWRNEFAAVFGAAAPEQLVTFDRIAEALAAYQRSMVFVNNPFAEYVAGDFDALTAAQKRGAILFYTDAQDGGGGCHSCHSGDAFTDGEHHTIGFPQFGPGKGDGVDDDFGRERETASADDRYRFRTPSLLNVAVTAPYGHAGTYESLQQVLQHYNNPRGTVNNFFDDDAACSLDQFETNNDCATLYPNAAAASDAALDKLAQERNQGESLFVNTDLNNNERADIVAFLQALTDPCVVDRDCLAPWIADPQDAGPDGQQLNAVDGNGNPL